jgi:hypothetical protein
MTAANLIVGRAAAYLVADCASYDEDGRVVALGRKVRVNDTIRMAISDQSWHMPGRAHRRLDRWLAEQGDQGEALAALPALLDKLMGMMAEDAPAAARHEPILQLYVATWSLARRRPECFVMTSSADGTLPTRVVPGRLHPCVEYVSPPVPGFSSGPKFDPYADGLRLVEAQRAVLGDDGFHVVGGGAHLATVDADGARLELLCTWPDCIGRRIDPQRSWDDRWWDRLWRRLRRGSRLTLAR